MTDATAPPEFVAVQAWIAQKVAGYVERDPSDIDPDVDLVTYGMDSLRALTLSANIEDEYDLEMDPQIAWRHRTVNGIARVVLDGLADR